MYAIVDFKGFQYRAEKDAVLKVPFLDGIEAGTEIHFERVLMLQNGNDILVGQPTVDSAKVVVEVIGHGKDKKVIVFKKKRRKGYRKKNGHRQRFTEVKVKDILN